jgi:hypothetical protein
MGSEVSNKQIQCSAPPKLSFEVSNITGTRSMIACDIDPTMSTGMVAKALSNEFSLPQNVCWTLRNDDSAEFLDEQREISSQVEPGAHLTLTPKAHLG